MKEAGTSYIGIDIVDEVIEKNKSSYNLENVDFRIANICEDELPKGDIIMVREFLFHLSYNDINNFLINLSKTDYKYLLTSTHIVNQNYKNMNIQTGDFRVIDLFSEPFDFDSKLVRVNDFPQGHSVKNINGKKFVPTHLTKLVKSSL